MSRNLFQFNFILPALNTDSPLPKEAANSRIRILNIILKHPETALARIREFEPVINNGYKQFFLLIARSLYKTSQQIIDPSEAAVAGGGAN